MIRIIQRGFLEGSHLQISGHMLSRRWGGGEKKKKTFSEVHRPLRAFKTKKRILNSIPGRYR